VKQTGNPAEEQYSGFLQCLEVTTELLRDKPHVALAQIINAFCERLMATTDESHRFELAQLAFITVGLVSLIYCPKLSPDTQKLELQLDTDSLHETWIHGSCAASGESIDSPFSNLLQSFLNKDGPLSLSSTPSSHGSMYGQSAVTTTTLTSANISFYTLRTLAGISLEPTESVLEHLELDVTRNRLKIFRFPSFCVIACQVSDHPVLKCIGSGKSISDVSTCSHLSPLFDDILGHTDSLDDPSNSDVPTQNAQAFYREILLTYRVIFGQDTHSWSILPGRIPASFLHAESVDSDPLLEDLMARPWRKQIVFSKIKAGPAKVVYPVADFPFFGNRLRALQEFVLTQAPDNFWSVIRDRRDINRLWNIRAAMIFGISATFLGFMQIVVAVIQITKQ